LQKSERDKGGEWRIEVGLRDLIRALWSATTICGVNILASPIAAALVKELFTRQLLPADSQRECRCSEGDTLGNEGDILIFVERVC
jgi:hypothetical protein